MTTDHEIEPEVEDLVIDKLSTALRQAARNLGPQEARYLVDAYYQAQDVRIRNAHQVRSMEEGADPGILVWYGAQSKLMEGQIKGALQAFAEGQEVGKWMLSITGIGPVIAAGMLAHIDISKAPTAGNIWSFAGLNPKVEWRSAADWRKRMAELLNLPKLPVKLSGGQVEVLSKTTGRKIDLDGEELSTAHLATALAKRPWNRTLKVLCWKLGTSFWRVHNKENDFYGHIMAKRKAEEILWNEAGENKAASETILASKNIGKSTEAYKAYSIGKLPPAHVQARAQRFTVKLFLSHLHHVMWESKYNEPPPVPYVIEHLGHRDYIAPPNWPM